MSVGKYIKCGYCEHETIFEKKNRNFTKKVLTLGKACVTIHLIG